MSTIDLDGDVEIVATHSRKVGESGMLFIRARRDPAAALSVAAGLLTKR